ncbi:MAG: sensor histidine kinase KdpD [Pseudomonadota bacterium]
MKDDRPNPDALLKTMQHNAGANKRGRLKIFFGACAGVGKTYAMLSAAREKHEDGASLLVGLVETHGRIETEALVEGLPYLQRITIDHRGVAVHEFDLDAALKAKPGLILVDELAHTNAPGSRHPKRWMDIVELLDAGIDVYSTLNVQHVESLNDIVTRITGIRVKETVPDNVFDSADEVSLVDLPSDDLLERLREGKVYTTDIGRKRAAENFFKRENLLALRELALRRVAERLDTHAGENGGARKVGDRLAVCIGPGDLTPKLLRTTKRMADALRATWVAVYVENARHYRLGHAAQLKLERNLRLAEEMGGKTELLQGDDAAVAIANYAHTKGITKIITGKPPKSFWRELLQRSLANELIRASDRIDVYVVSGNEHVEPLSYSEIKPPLRQWRGYLFGILLTALITAGGMMIRESFNGENVIMLYLLIIIILAERYGWAVSMVTSFLAFICFNLFFVQPYYSLTVNSYNDVVTLVLLLGTGFFASLQTSNLQAQSRFFRRKERNTSALYAMSQELANTRQRDDLTAVIKRRLEQALDGSATLFFPDAHGDFESFTGIHTVGVREEIVVRWVFGHQQPAGLGTTTMPSVQGYFVPLRGSSGTFGVLGLIPHTSGHILSPEERDMVDTFGALAAAALERVTVSAVAETRKVEAESEKLRNALLSSVSHDLRTPLASIKGVISSLLLEDDRTDAATRQELLHSAHDEVARLERVVGNLLDVTRLEGGEVKLKLDYYFAPELIGSAIKQTATLLKHHYITTDIDPHLPAVWIDGLLIEQVLVNVLENAAKYTPAGSTVTVIAKSITPEWLEIAVEDNGPGIPQAQEQHIFDKFTTFAVQQNTYGAGLGLTICRAIMQVHGGTISARNREVGGARFSFTLPIAANPEPEQADAE